MLLLVAKLASSRIWHCSYLIRSWESAAQITTWRHSLLRQATRVSWHSACGRQSSPTRKWSCSQMVGKRLTGVLSCLCRLQRCCTWLWRAAVFCAWLLASQLSCSTAKKSKKTVRSGSKTLTSSESQLIQLLNFKIRGAFHHALSKSSRCGAAQRSLLTRWCSRSTSHRLNYFWSPWLGLLHPFKLCRKRTQNLHRNQTLDLKALIPIRCQVLCLICS